MANYYPNKHLKYNLHSSLSFTKIKIKNAYKSTITLVYEKFKLRHSHVYLTQAHLSLSLFHFFQSNWYKTTRNFCLRGKTGRYCGVRPLVFARIRICLFSLIDLAISQRRWFFFLFVDSWCKDRINGDTGALGIINCVFRWRMYRRRTLTQRKFKTSKFSREKSNSYRKEREGISHETFYYLWSNVRSGLEGSRNE